MRLPQTSQKRARKHLVDSLLVDPGSGVIIDAGGRWLGSTGGKERRHLPHESHEALSSGGIRGSAGGEAGIVALTNVLVHVVNVDSAHFSVSFVAERVTGIVAPAHGKLVTGFEGANVAEVTRGQDAGVSGS